MYEEFPTLLFASSSVVVTPAAPNVGEGKDVTDEPGKVTPPEHDTPAPSSGTLMSHSIVSKYQNARLAFESMLGLLRSRLQKITDGYSGLLHDLAFVSTKVCVHEDSTGVGQGEVAVTFQLNYRPFYHCWHHRVPERLRDLFNIDNHSWTDFASVFRSMATRQGYLERFIVNKQLFARLVLLSQVGCFEDGIDMLTLHWCTNNRKEFLKWMKPSGSVTFDSKINRIGFSFPFNFQFETLLKLNRELTKNMQVAAVKQSSRRV